MSHPYAFPWDTPEGGGSCGMELRDYFAAHAPANSEPWFEPTLKPVPAVNFNDLFKDDPFAANYEAEIKSWIRDDAGADLSAFVNLPLSEEDAGVLSTIQATIEKAQATRAEVRAWNLKQRFIQWPYAWADAMLQQREVQP